ncbi:DUF1579 domain-containing protein [Brevundimonas sp.]|uniref:DUF1579 domain-containing protein n=1 Tax=Brevundimonas sp. TaxID=1871086 RepID=UPI0025D5068E|nr:DUF1579 domain-containing protein [Brevundimonas sp.]
MEKAEPAEEHRWLQRLIGDWTVEGRAIPDKPEHRSTGVETVSAYGDYWVVFDGEARMGGQEPARSRITLGFDPTRGVFVGSFVSTHMPSFWGYEGRLDEGGRLLRLACRGPRMDGSPGEADYEDVIEIVSDDERKLRSTVRGADGQWSEFMVATYRRKT